MLDLGCGYGNHLMAAAQRGWQCFGVELSDHLFDLGHHFGADSVAGEKKEMIRGH